jgi:peptidoglycan/LPS O-acetylase OafA/YrhL
VKEAAAPHRIPSLDGIRALSIVLVLLGHLSGTKGFPNVDLGIGDYAHLGVVVFFVISGFLITGLLLSEHAKNGRISLRLFYARRALRLFPASYAYIACVFLLWIAGLVRFETRNFWYAITYTVNYLPGAGWEIGHLWSLSVEEQFYFLWPSALIVFGPRRVSRIAGAMILLGPVARAAVGFFLRGTVWRDLNYFPVVADSLAMGCLLAGIRPWLETQKWYLRLFRPAWSAAILISIPLINRYMDHTAVWIVGTSVIGAGIAVLIHRSVWCSGDWVGKILNAKPIAFVGVLSYSLYLWQQLFLNRNSTAWVNAFPQNLMFAVAAALASYFFLEKTMLRLRHKLRPASALAVAK